MKRHYFILIVWSVDNPQKAVGMLSVTNSCFNALSYESNNICCFPKAGIPNTLHPSDTVWGIKPKYISASQDVFDDIVAYGVLLLNQLLQKV